MKKGVKDVTTYYTGLEEWADKCMALHDQLLSLDYTSAIKWGRPVYSYLGENLLGVSRHKHFLTLMFFQGALLNDESKLLINAQEGVTKAMRQWRFHSPDEMVIDRITPYLKEAKSLQGQGKRVKKARAVTTVVIPEELTGLMDTDNSFSEAFKNLTPGRQKEYAEYISSAKREATKQSRLEKIKPLIIEGKGLHDKYR